MTEYEKPGETRLATPEDILWLQCQPRYLRDAVVSTTSRHFLGPDGSPTRLDSGGVLPNMFVTFAGLTSRHPGIEGLCYIVRSWRHTDHGGFWDQENEWAAEHGKLELPNTVVLLQNTQSSDLGLVIEGRTRRLEASKEKLAMSALNIARRLKGLPPTTPDPPSEKAQPYSLYLMTPMFMYTQGERKTDGQHTGEGHPKLALDALNGFEDLPGLGRWGRVPRDRDEAFRHLRRLGYHHPALDSWSARNPESRPDKIRRVIGCAVRSRITAGASAR
jgi:hypothetical protein